MTAAIPGGRLTADPASVEIARRGEHLPGRAFLCARPSASSWRRPERRAASAPPAGIPGTPSSSGRWSLRAATVRSWPPGHAGAAPASSDDLEDHGGAVIAEAAVYAIWWGDPARFPADAMSGIDGFLTGLQGSRYVAIADQYVRRPAKTTFVGHLMETSPSPTHSPQHRRDRRQGVRGAGRRAAGAEPHRALPRLHRRFPGAVRLLRLARRRQVSRWPPHPRGLPAERRTGTAVRSRRPVPLQRAQRPHARAGERHRPRADGDADRPRRGRLGGPHGRGDCRPVQLEIRRLRHPREHPVAAPEGVVQRGPRLRPGEERGARVAVAP